MTRRESPHIPADTDYEIWEFRNCKSGLLVTRSAHYYETRSTPKPKKRRDRQKGIIVDKNFFQDSKGRIICWPVVWWEGGVMGSMTHPTLVTPFYKKDRDLPKVTMDDGQWGTYGPPEQANEKRARGTYEKYGC